MARQLGVGLLTKLARNGHLTNLELAPPSPFLKPNSSPFLQRFSSEYATLSPPSHFWRINGVFPTSLLARRFFSTALFQPSRKFPLSIRSFHSLDRGRRSIFRRFTTDKVVLGLIVTNVAVFSLWKVADTQFMMKHFTLSVEDIKRGRLHTLITSAFSHHDPFHLVFNMIGLYFFGTSIGHCFGPQFLLKLYLGGAISGSIFFLVYHTFISPSLQGKLQRVTDPTHSCLGASGALNAIMLLDIFLFPTKTILVDLIIPVPAALFGAYVIGKDIWRVLEGDSRVSGSAHLGGATVAFLAWLRNRKGRFGRF